MAPASLIALELDEVSRQARHRKVIRAAVRPRGWIGLGPVLVFASVILIPLAKRCDQTLQFFCRS
ncbi:hypothetical protein B5U98_26870 [Bosea sp. Tri-39]|nr:hypothetical protein BLM15_29070 [Bosea sp. Tri-49]RXT16787.1 hypothetical protein B5U98_26870 [Bosea sp. Tri-39]RXT37692.1 hypothetical protein B5U99_12150 [Bosea sp. Tri-54]